MASAYGLILLTLEIFLLGSVLAKYPSPLLFVKFNGNTHDLSGNNPDPTVGSSSSYTTGPYGESEGAIYFDGTPSSSLQWDNGADGPMDFKTEFTWIAWVKNMGSTIGLIFGFYDTPNAVTGIEIWEWDDENEFYLGMVDSTTSSYETVSTTFATDTWVQVAFTYQKSTGYHRLYKNGVLHWHHTQVWTQDLLTNTAHVKMGQRANNDQTFDGAVACVQLYGVYMSYGDISKVSALCNPEYVALNPWPVPLGIWPLNDRFGSRDMKFTAGENHITAYRTYLESGYPGSSDGSYQLVGDWTSYLEIDNTDHGISPLNGITFSLWLYPSDETNSYPLLQYEYGTEEGGIDNWALHIWSHPNSNLYMCMTTTCNAELSILKHRWNYVAISLDFSIDEISYMVNDVTTKSAVNTGKAVLLTDLAPRIRIGKTFYEPDGRYANARYSCLQVYDMPMTLEEMRSLSERCQSMGEGLDGEAPGLVLMYPFDKQHKCSSAEPVRQRQNIQNHECVLVTGPRGRDWEALRIVQSDIVGDRVLLGPADSVTDYENGILQTSSFTLMYYVRLDNTDGTTTKIGFVKSDGSPSDTWIEITSNSSLEFSAGGLTTSDSETTIIEDVHLPDENEWMHIAVTCNSLSARCYLFRNGLFIGESVEDINKDWLASTRLFIEISTQNQDPSVDISCLQLYNRVLSKAEITNTKDRCSLLGDTKTPPLPVGFWPMDKIYKNRELTGRSRDVNFTETVYYTDSSPLSSPVQGSVHIGAGTDTYGVIPASPGTTIRHSLTLQSFVYVDTTSGGWQASEWAPFFTIETGISGRSISNHFHNVGDDDIRSNFRLFSGPNAPLHAVPDSARAYFTANTWYRLATSFNFQTGIIKNYLNGVLQTEQKVTTTQTEINVAAEVWIGKEEDDQHYDGVIKLSCVQLYDRELTVEQMDKAAQLCDHTTNSNFRRPEVVSSGWTQQHINSTTTVRGKLDCMQMCVNNPQCLALNYHPDTTSCEITDLLLSDTGVSSFQNTGGVYLEKVHPLIAQSL